MCASLAGTDILVITEETLEDILADPIYGNMTLPRRHSLLLSAVQPLADHEELLDANSRLLRVPSVLRHVKRLSLVPPFHHRHLLQGIHGMSVGGAGTCAYSTNREDRVTQARILLTLRRRKSVQRNNIHIDPIALLDYSYDRVTDRFLDNAANWRFNTFTLDIMTGGHSLSRLLFYLFDKYDFIGHFKLDIVNVWKCFRKYMYTARRGTQSPTFDSLCVKLNALLRNLRFDICARVMNVAPDALRAMSMNASPIVTFAYKKQSNIADRVNVKIFAATVLCASALCYIIRYAIRQ